LRAQRKERYSARQAETYLKILAHMQRRYDIVDRGAPQAPGYEPGPDPPEPDPDTLEQLQAHVTVFASKEVRDELYPAWRKELERFDDFVKKKVADLSEGDALVQASRHRTLCRQRRDAVVARIRRELEALPGRKPNRLRAFVSRVTSVLRRTSDERQSPNGRQSQLRE
jgi:hypothetical protein